MERQFKYVGLIAALYITMQMVSGISAGKITVLFGLPISVATLYFPLTYIFADILTEVYGFAQSRRVIWMVFFSSVLAGIIFQLAVSLPPAPDFDANEAYARVLGVVPRILVASWLAILAGSFLNDYVLAKMKVWTKGKYLWSRTIGSTIVGEFVDSAVFFTIGLYGVISNDLLLTITLSAWIVKVGVEVLMTPVTYAVVGWLKREENVDHYDHNTDFNPLILR